MLPNYEEERSAVGSTIRLQAETVLKAHHALFEGIQGEDAQKLDEARELLSGINAAAIRTDNDIIRLLARFAPEARELRTLVVYLKVVNNIVRVSDNIKSMSKHMRKILDQGANIAPLRPKLEKMHRCVLYAFELAIRHIDGDLERINYREIHDLVVQEEACSDHELKEVEGEIMKQGGYDDALRIEMIGALHLVRKMERTADRAVDIARLMCYAQEGGMIESV